MSKSHLKVEPGKQEITGQRDFDAPRDLVFKAYTDPSLIPQWWGPAKYKTRVEALDARPGGHWRFVQKGDQSPEEAFRGVFHEVIPGELIIQTFEYEGLPGHHVILETITFEDLGARTRVTDQLVFQSVADRDGMVQSGMEGGANESAERLTELLKKVPASR